MSAWSNFKDKAGKWAESIANHSAKDWKDREAATKAIGAGFIGGVAAKGFPEHDGWRKEVRQNIANRQIDRETQSFQDQLTNSLKDIKIPDREIDKDKERER